MERDVRLQSDGCYSFADFTTLMKTLTETTINGVRFIEAYPHGNDSETISTPIITYSVIKRIPLEIKRRYRERPFEDPEDPNHTISVYGQKFEYIIEFVLWHENNKKAEELMNQFEEILDIYKGDLKRSGVVEFVFSEQLEDNKNITAKDRLANRTLRYVLHLDKITTEKIPLLKLITLRVNNELIFVIDEKNNYQGGNPE